jgi:hypothetical protein
MGCKQGDGHAIHGKHAFVIVMVRSRACLFVTQFVEANSFNQPLDGWQVGTVTTMQFMVSMLLWLEKLVLTLTAPIVMSFSMLEPPHSIKTSVHGI